MNYPISTISLSLLKTEPKPPASNEEELEKLQTQIDLQKSKGHKYPLLACVFLLFRTAGKKTLTKTEMYDLMEKKAIEDKTKIVSSPTERYCIITQNNYKSKIKDIVKKKKWFTRALDDKGEIIYTLNEGVVCQIRPKIESYLNVIEKRDGIFQNKAREEIENIEKPPQEKKRKKNKFKKVIFKKHTPNKNNNPSNNTQSISNNIPNNNEIIKNNEEIKNEIKKETKEIKIENVKNLNNLNSVNSLNINTLNTLNTENSLNNNSSNINNDMEIEEEKYNIISTSINKGNKENKENSVVMNSNNNENIKENNNKDEKVNASNTLIKPNFQESEKRITVNRSKSKNNNVPNNKKKSKVNKLVKITKPNEQKIIRQSRSISKVIEIKENDDDFDIIIEDEKEKSYINNNNNNKNENNNDSLSDLTEETKNLKNEIEAILSGKKEINKSLTNTINNKGTKKINKNKKESKNKKIKKNTIEELSLDSPKENIDESEDNTQENKVIDLTSRKKTSINLRKQNTATPNPEISIISKNKNKNSNKNYNKQNTEVKHLLNNKRKPPNSLSPLNNSSISFYNKNSNNGEFKKKKPLEEKNFPSSDNNLYEDKKAIKKKDSSKKNNIIGPKMNSIISMGELLLNLLNKEELSQLMNKKIVYFKQRIEKKEKEINSDKKLIEDLIHSCDKIKLLKYKDINDSINDLKSYYKIFKDKIESLNTYKIALEKSDNQEKNFITENITNYKQVYIECNQLLIRMVNLINSMVKEYDNLDEFVSILILEEKEAWTKQNIGMNGSDFRKKIKNAKSVDDIGELLKEELDKVKMDNNLYKKYEKIINNNTKTPQNENEEIIIELNKKNKNNKEKMLRIDEKNVIRIEDNNKNISKKNKKNNFVELNKENFNLTNKNISGENTRTNKKDKAESIDTNPQSITLQSDGENGNSSISIK